MGHPPIGELSATGVAEYATCPRRARFRGGAPEHLGTSAISAIVRRGLYRAAESRVAKEPYDLAYVIHDLLRVSGLSTDTALFERARLVTRRGLEALVEFEPVSAETEFETTLAGARVRGTIDLVARRGDGRIVIFAFRTGEAPSSSFAIQLALAKSVVADTYADAAYVVLSLEEGGASLREADLPARSMLERYVLDANERKTDEPQPGYYCSSCEFLPRCLEGQRNLVEVL